MVRNDLLIDGYKEYVEKIEDVRMDLEERIEELKRDMKVIQDKVNRIYKRILGVELAGNYAGLGLGVPVIAGIIVTTLSGGTAIPFGVLALIGAGVGLTSGGINAIGKIADKKGGDKEINVLLEKIVLALNTYDVEMRKIELEIDETQHEFCIKREINWKDTLEVAANFFAIAKAGGGLAAQVVADNGTKMLIRFAGDAAEAGAGIAIRNGAAVGLAVIGVAADGYFAVKNTNRMINSLSPKATAIAQKLEHFQLLKQYIANDVEIRKVLAYLRILPSSEKFQEFFTFDDEDFDYVFSK